MAVVSIPKRRAKLVPAPAKPYLRVIKGGKSKEKKIVLPRVLSTDIIIARYPPFPKDKRDEIVARLGQAIQEGKEAEKQLAKLRKGNPKRRALFQIIREAKKARAELILHSAALVRRIASKYSDACRRGIRFDDLEGYGFEGLTKAVGTFDQRKGTFSKHVGAGIEVAILEGIHRENPMYFTRNMFGRLRNIEAALKAYDAAGKEKSALIARLSDAQLKIFSEIKSPEHTREMRRRFEETRRLVDSAIGIRALDKPAYSDRKTTLLATIGVPARSGELAERENVFRIIDKEIARLPERDAEIMRLKYYSSEELDNQDIGRKLGVTREAVRQKEAKILEQLRKRLAGKLADEAKGRVLVRRSFNIKEKIELLRGLGVSPRLIRAVMPRISASNRSISYRVLERCVPILQKHGFIGLLPKLRFDDAEQSEERFIELIKARK